MKKTLFSGIQPTSNPHIGNYLGALKNWVSLQNEYRALYALVDLHAITIKLNPEELAKNTIESAKDLLAIGLDHHVSPIFIQSHVHQHAELAWILNTITPMSELERMTQYKDKVKQHKENINVGLFDYPVLMAADILLYKAEIIPVGEDQVQHVELARIIARKFNKRYGHYFPEPHALVTEAKRIMSLTNPRKKMSKSHGPANYISLSDEPGVIRKKIMKAVTDEGPQKKEKISPGVKNLFDLLRYFEAKKEYDELMEEYEKGSLKYAILKNTVADIIINTLSPIQKRRQEISNDDIKKILDEGASKARAIAEKNMKDIKKIIGLVPSRR